MESAFAKLGVLESDDPFADPLFDMGFSNFPVVKIGNVRASSLLGTNLSSLTVGECFLY
jgi:hypothetical protein